MGPCHQGPDRSNLASDRQSSTADERQAIPRIAKDIEALSLRTWTVPAYGAAFLERLCSAIPSEGGAFWTNSDTGMLQQEAQIGWHKLRFDRKKTAEAMHKALVELGVKRSRPMMVAPNSCASPSEVGDIPTGNPTPYALLLAPILCDDRVRGIIEAWVAPTRAPDTLRGFLQFTMRMASHASSYMQKLTDE